MEKEILERILFEGILAIRRLGSPSGDYSDSKRKEILKILDHNFWISDLIHNIPQVISKGEGYTSLKQLEKEIEALDKFEKRKNNIYLKNTLCEMKKIITSIVVIQPFKEL